MTARVSSQDVPAHLAALPLVAILRGLKPHEAVEIAKAVVEAGFRCLEVPLNSPDALVSVRLLRDALGGRAVVGAGTVLTPDAVQAVARAGGQIVVSPNADPEVIRATKHAGLTSMPGFFTPSEAFTALEAGADVLKLFPADVAGPAGLKALRAVLPSSTPVYVVGGVEPATIGPWRAAGASGFGIGSALYKPGRSPAETGLAARAFIDGWNASTDAR